MYIRRIAAGTQIFGIGSKLQQIYFVTSGKIDLLDKRHQLFMQLPPSSVLGDYQLLFDLKTNMVA
jgi:hypothetical protein